MTISDRSGPPSHPRGQSTHSTRWTTPQPADVINYLYLWRHEYERGEEDGRKVRPCLVLSTYLHRGRTIVLMSPITTQDLTPRSVEVPAEACRTLGLDVRSRIVWGDVNRFAWVGPDVRTTRSGSPLIGAMPYRVWEEALAKVVAHSVPITPRNE